MEDINSFIDRKPDVIQSVGDLEVQEDRRKDIIDEILDDFGELDSLDNNKENSINFLDIFKNPIIKPFIKQGLEILLKYFAKQKMTQIAASKGSQYIADNLLNMAGRPSYRSMRKKGVKGKKQYNEIMDYREKFIKENFKGKIEEQIKKSVKNKKVF